MFMLTMNLGFCMVIMIIIIIIIILRRDNHTPPPLTFPLNYIICALQL